MVDRPSVKYRARLAETPEDLRKARRLRFRAFRGEGPGLDTDDLDPLCKHFLVEVASSGQVVCCFRILPLENGSQIGRSYSARYYNLSQLEGFEGPMVEMGRFCVDPDFTDPDIVRLAWAAMTRYVDENGVQMLFGCSSFKGTEAKTYFDAFALLKDRHLAPKRWLPRVKAPKVFRFASRLKMRKPDLKKAMKSMPPLLRTYLFMGGWVSDHAVVDRDLGTLHVFTGLEIGRVPAARARLLRAG